MEKVRVKIPASTANVGPGYDVYGIALSLYNTITLEKSNSLQIVISGSKADKSIPADKSNLVYQSIKRFYGSIQKPCPEFNLTIDCNIPLASGLGSSSTAIVGGIAAANKLEGEPLSVDELITLAWKIEGHPDNTTTAILGGFVISTITENNTIAFRKLSWPKQWQIIIAHPEYQVSTQQARNVIPANVSIQDAIYNMSRCSFLVYAICNQDDKALKMSLKDKLHQQYRSKLIPGLNEIIEELETMDVYGTVLSGAGPSICIITKNDNDNEITSRIKEIWKSKNLEGEFFRPVVDNIGLHYFKE
jgi:homoserine kinase